MVPIFSVNWLTHVEYSGFLFSAWVNDMWRISLAVVSDLKRYTYLVDNGLHSDDLGVRCLWQGVYLSALCNDSHSDVWYRMSQVLKWRFCIFFLRNLYYQVRLESTAISQDATSPFYYVGKCVQNGSMLMWCPSQKCVCVCDLSVCVCSNQKTEYKFEKEVWWTEKSWGGEGYICSKCIVILYEIIKTFLKRPRAFKVVHTYYKWFYFEWYDN